VYDSSTYPDGTNASTVGSYLCNLVVSRGLPLNANTYYSLYTPQPPIPDPNDPRYVDLGYHTEYSCNGVPLRFGIIFDADDYGLVTDTEHHWSNHTAAAVNTSAHELMETITDPSPPSGWFASSVTGENGDKCNFSFAPSPYVTLTNGAIFKLQGEWSNNANSSGTGFANGNGEPGCLISSAPPFTATIAGPLYMTNAVSCTWTSTVSGGVPPYTYSWQVQEPGYPYFYPNYGTQSTFTTRSTSYSFSGYFVVSLSVTDATGRSTGAGRPVTDYGSSGSYDPAYCH
jgi:hypothetical protein